MKITVTNDRQDRTYTLGLNSWARLLFSLCLLGLPAMGGLVAGLQLSGGQLGAFLEDSIKHLRSELDQQKNSLESEKQNAQRQLDAMTLKLAEMQARLVRLDALGERLADMSRLDKGEFDFSHLPALGGPEDAASFSGQTDLDQLFSSIDNKIHDREQQLAVLETMLSNRDFQRESTVAGRPARKGWISSRYGWRNDPFNGRRAWHNGVDFASREDTAVIAVAAGVVTWSGERGAYGQMVEIDHGDGLITLYGHNHKLLVKVGDVVRRGMVIALMGSTGRSTGPHVHFEVYKNGRSVDPASYVRRTIR